MKNEMIRQSTFNRYLQRLEISVETLLFAFSPQYNGKCIHYFVTALQI